MYSVRQHIPCCGPRPHRPSIVPSHHPSHHTRTTFDTETSHISAAAYTEEEEEAHAEEEARRQEEEDKRDEEMLLDAEERALFEETEANLRNKVTSSQQYCTSVKCRPSPLVRYAARLM